MTILFAGVRNRMVWISDAEKLIDLPYQVSVIQKLQSIQPITFIWE